MTQSWRLDDARQTIVLGAQEGRLAEVVYWGPRLSDDENLTTLVRAGKIDVTGGMLDENPDLSICPEATRSFPGQPGMVIHDTTGAPILPRFQFAKADEAEGSLVLHYTDVANGLRYIAHFALDPQTHMNVTKAVLEADAAVHLHWLAAPVLPGPQLSDEIIDFSGRWCGEFQMNRTAWSAGIRSRENRTGRTGHEHFPGLLVPCRGAGNTHGHVYGFHYGWSGGHKMIAEELPDGRRQIQFGHASQIEHATHKRFETSPLYAVFSDSGINGCAVSFQRHLRDKIVSWPDPARPRPVHYNSWEAVYFDHDLTVLQDLATRASDLGAERFVLDDGWFGNRDNDEQSLADWVVDPRKYPQGLNPLIAHVNDLGMSFGIWFEPEMINPDSEIYRAHPDWATGADDQILGRQQKVLDMANPEVRDYLFERISDVLQNHAIDYIKWDHNRVLPLPDAAQTRGSYALLDKVRMAFPKVEIESCASGGGRIDFGILSRTHRVWLSDSNDALERLQMQHNAAIFLPMVVIGSHVGPRQCHTSGRTLDLHFRAWVAAQRHMGFEMDPRELSKEETRVLTEVTTWWKHNRAWMERADILRLDSPDPAVVAEQQQAQDDSQFVVFAGKARTSPQISPRPLQLTRLQPDAMYRINLINRIAAPNLSRGNPLLKTKEMDVTGGYLMNHGLTLPWSFPETMWVIEGTRL
ncbi:alpha-galactosidase [Sulfitobacter sp. SK012]|uniref:alpha-galactosidase n=1 Tax=Sulfitobacter sp. SK012 TaxID=1389005 RepID=UPI000E0AB43F|nr:alpha-galactosidase [Sulfitobacter sp. SK012]AXI44695.1 alpha-galactosidase [Sulfitobacter sp. SK012]